VTEQLGGGVFLALIALPALLGFSGCATTKTDYPTPSVVLLESGDLIWPRPPGAFIPYRSQLGQATGNEAAEWEQEKAQYLAELTTKRRLTRIEQERVRLLQTMNYARFAQLYFAPIPSGQPSPRGSFVYVGHVGIILVEGGSPFVVEAVADQGHAVRKISYARWLAQHRHDQFWVRRLQERSPEKRSAIAQVALSYLGRPYNFWNFDLKDDRCFYCSKLAWLAIYKAVHYPPDDNDNGDRVLWYSPRQLIHSPHLEPVFDSGNYAATR